MEKRSRKKKPSRAQENEAFMKAAYSQFEIVKKKLDKKKEEARESINRAMESVLFHIPSEVLNTKLKDLPNETCEKRTNQSEGKKQTKEVTQERSIDSENKPPMEVLQPRNLLRVAADSNMFKTPGCNSVSKYVGTPNVSNMGILRIPEPGEYALSSSGSPLLISTSATDTVNISIPLKCGKKIAILPNADVIPGSISSDLDPGVKSQLMQLTNTLTMILKDV